MTENWLCYLAALAFPNKVGLPSGTAHLVCFLGLESDCEIFDDSRKHCPYKSADVDSIWMHFPARGTLDFESVPEVILGCIVWPQVRHATYLYLSKRSLVVENH